MLSDKRRTRAVHAPRGPPRLAHGESARAVRRHGRRRRPASDAARARRGHSSRRGPHAHAGLFGGPAHGARRFIRRVRRQGRLPRRVVRFSRRGARQQRRRRARRGPPPAALRRGKGRRRLPQAAEETVVREPRRAVHRGRRARQRRAAGAPGDLRRRPRRRLRVFVSRGASAAVRRVAGGAGGDDGAPRLRGHAVGVARGAGAPGRGRRPAAGRARVAHRAEDVRRVLPGAALRRRALRAALHPGEIRPTAAALPRRGPDSRARGVGGRRRGVTPDIIKRT